ncbi:MAG: FAD-binding oxidoreductase [Desulfobacterales bacterium]|nr:FAD-binding oxidoreductase [Desulfobacterales bacterium]
MPKTYDAVIVGAGSVGVPTALALARKGVKTLVVDKRASPGQGENKHAIGGVRATHSEPAKILACLRSLEIFATWEALYGDDIEWLQGGYVFPVYRETEERLLTAFLPMQKRFGLTIDYVGPEKIQLVVPGINPDGLRGGTFSPADGSASPLLAVNAFYRQAQQAGAVFEFHTAVEAITLRKGAVTGVATTRGRFAAPVVVDAAGACSRELAAAIGCSVPVIPESHEAAITEPVAMFCPAMVVDLRPAPGSKNYYFYQNRHGQVVFCITPDPPIVGDDYRETSAFLPQVCARLVALLPRLKNLRVRRVWRGLYPMTGDGSPLLGWNREARGLLHVTGMCGQGFMLGPGLGEVIAEMITESVSDSHRRIIDAFSLYRDMACTVEVLK